jgi:hypothetical protein
MKFKIRRASGTSDDVAPCDNAKKGKDGNWYISFSSLKQLAEFVDIHGSIIIGTQVNIIGEESDSTLKVTIYDYYVE